MAKRKSKKNTGWQILLATLFAAIVFLIGYGIRESWLENQRSKNHYKAFCIQIPKNYSIHGIDVSKYQKHINWESVHAMVIDSIHIGFAFIKATEGNGNKDAYFKRNWKKAKEAGLVRGAYHFFLATKNGKIQAENFIEQVSLEAGDLPPVIDIEQTFGVPQSKICQRLKDFLATIESHYGVTPIIYTNVDFYKQYLQESFFNYPLWVAHYFQSDRPSISRTWQFWQHSERGRVNGIFSQVDFNVFNGDSADFKKILIQ